MERGAYHHGNLSDALLDAAEVVLAEGREPSLRELAASVGVSPNAPYRHFPDKTALLAALAGRGFERLGAALEGRGLEEAFARYLAFAQQSPATFRLMFRETVATGLDPDMGPRKAFEALTNAVARELPSGTPVVHAVRGAMTAWATIHGYATLSVAGFTEDHACPGAAELAAIVRAGLRNARSPSPPRR